MSSPPPSSDQHGINNKPDESRITRNNTLSTPNSSSNNQNYSISTTNEDQSLTNSSSDAGLNVGAFEASQTPNPTNIDPRNNIGTENNAETSRSTAASRSSATATSTNNSDPIGNTSNASSSSVSSASTTAGRNRNPIQNFLFTYRDGRLVPVPIGSGGSPLNASPPNVDNSRPQQEGQEEVARLVSSVLNGLGLPVNPQSATAPSANESANPQPPPASLNTSSVDTLDDGLYSSMPSITNSHTHTQPQPSREEGTARNENPSSLANSGILLSMSFDVERRRPMFTSFMGARDGNGMVGSQPSTPSSFDASSASSLPPTPVLNGVGGDREADLEAFRRSMADARANGRDINWREAIRASRESSRPPSTRLQSSSQPQTPSPIPTSRSTSYLDSIPLVSSPLSFSSLPNPSNPPANDNANPGPIPAFLGGLPPIFSNAVPMPFMGGSGGPGGPGGPIPFPLFVPFFPPGMDIFSGEKPPDKRRARELLRGLKVAPKALIKRLEEVERVRSTQQIGISYAKKEGTEESVSDGQGKLLCAVCWDPLLPADVPTEKHESNDHEKDHDHDHEQAAMEVDDETVDGDAEDEEMDVDQEDTEISDPSISENTNEVTSSSNHSSESNSKSKSKSSKASRRPPPWTNQLIVLPCTHIFHAECLEPWFTTSKTTCPTCRFDVDPESLTLDLGRLFGGSRRSRATPNNASGSPAPAPIPAHAPAFAFSSAPAFAGAPDAATGRPEGTRNEEAASNDNNDNGGNEGNGLGGYMRGIFASTIARIIAGAIQAGENPTQQQQGASGNGSSQPTETAPQPGGRPRSSSWPPQSPPASIPGMNLPSSNAPGGPTSINGNRHMNNDLPSVGVPIVVIGENGPGDPNPANDPAVSGSINQILSSLFGAAAMAGPQPNQGSQRNQGNGSTNSTGFSPIPTAPFAPFNFNAPSLFAPRPRPPPATPGSGSGSTPSNTSFETIPTAPTASNSTSGPSRSQTPSPSRASPSSSWGFGFHRTYSLGPGLGLSGLGSGSGPGLVPGTMPGSTPLSMSLPSPFSQNSGIPSQGGRVPSSSYPSGINTPVSFASGNSSSRLGSRPSTPTPRHHPYAHARPSSLLSPLNGTDSAQESPASNTSNTGNTGDANSGNDQNAGQPPEYIVTHHTITFSWNLPGDVSMGDTYAIPNPTNDNTQRPQGPNPPNPGGDGFWMGVPHPFFARAAGNPGLGATGGIGATRTAPGSNINRPRRKWVAPEGSSLRSVVEAREREVGLRCDDVSCLWGPEDDDDPAEVKAVRPERVFLKKDGSNESTPTPACSHQFHPECLLVSARIADPMIEEEMGGGDDNEMIDVSCPRCRTHGGMKKAEWRCCRQLAELI